MSDPVEPNEYLILVNASTKLLRELRTNWSPAAEVAFIMVSRARWHISGMTEPYEMVRYYRSGSW